MSLRVTPQQKETAVLYARNTALSLRSHTYALPYRVFSVAWQHLSPCGIPMPARRLLTPRVRCAVVPRSDNSFLGGAHTHCFIVSSQRRGNLI
jgi:hypothetical protein